MSGRFHDFVDELKREREELKMQLHLAKDEIEHEWEALEEKWVEMETQFKQTGKEIVTALDHQTEVLGHELKDAYQRLKSRLKH